MNSKRLLLISAVSIKELTQKHSHRVEVTINIMLLITYILLDHKDLVSKLASSST